MDKMPVELDRRQRVNLSDEADEALKSDSHTFAVNNAINNSEMICRIFLAFAEYSAVRNGDTGKVEKYLAKKPSAASKKIPSLRNGVLNYLSQPDIKALWNSARYNKSPGKFIKAVVEEYAELPFIERELIFFRDVKEKLESGLNKVQRIVTGHKTLYIKPYKIIADSQSLYNYLVCYSSDSKIPGKFEISSLRLSRIKNENITIVPNGAFAFNDFEIDNIKQAIAEKGVQFLRSEITDVSVELTETGKILFNTIRFQRPETASVNGNIYNFRCTVSQADFYFFKFGAEAKIIKPSALKKVFLSRYKLAAEAYEY